MDELEELLADQRTTQALITNHLRNTKKIGEDNLTFEALNNRLHILEGYWKTFLDRHMRLSRHQEELAEEEYFAKDAFVIGETNYIIAKTFLTEKLAILTASALDNSAAVQTTHAPVMQLSTVATSLPKLTLPKFSGRQADWDSFKDKFTSMVKNIPTLTPTLKLQHLLSCLEDEAARTVKNIEVTGENFEVAWTALSRRYENKKLRISLYMKRLIYMQPATKKSVSEYTRLLDTTSECRRGLKTLGEPVEHWDRWFVSLVVFNLDAATREQWEHHIAQEELLPSFDKLEKYLENKIQAIDTAHCPDPEGHPRNAKPAKPTRSVSVHHAGSTESQAKRSADCTLCSADHRISACPDFNGYSAEERWNYAREKKLCFNCLSPKHQSTDCKSIYRCRVCKQSHHTKLHRNASSSDRPVGESSAGVSSHTATFAGTTLLGTAQAVAINHLGEKLKVRVLIDPASQGSFVTERLVQLLSLHKRPAPLNVSGVGGHVTAICKSAVSVTLQSSYSDSNVIILAAVLSKLTSLLPKQAIIGPEWKHAQGLQLADPTYRIPGQIDCLLGADVFPELLRPGLRTGPTGTPVAVNTIFGWMLIGPTCTSTVATDTVSSYNITISPIEPVSQELRKFWEIEEIPEASPLTQAEEQCEQHFRSTHQRDESGRFVICLPFISEPRLPGLHAIAKQRFVSLEHRLRRDSALSQSYGKFMQDYEEMQHMRKTPHDMIHKQAAYIPHHAVHHAVSKKLRVVFNASQRASNGKSLNDYLHVGPKLQSHISTILLRWRQGRIAFVTDIVKMFRQIKVHNDDVHWQRILWRADPAQHMQDFDLTTVTYGTACAPYLSIRVLLQLADDEQHRYPEGSNILRKHMYVDDALVSCDTEEDAIKARRSLIKILQSAGMELDKWASNCPSVLMDQQPKSNHDKVFKTDTEVATLGLRWTPSTDMFSYSVPEIRARESLTKRSILSHTARLFDPTGWISPVLIRAKMLLQNLWLLGNNWDELADEKTKQAWSEFVQQLPDVHQIKIPRWIGIKATDLRVIHGFCDASERAYAAVVYLVSNEQVTLLTAKSRVAPLQTISLPRLELCGALLLARLTAATLKDLEAPNLPLYCWSDSQVVLAWLRASPCSWATFVANRTSEIHRLIPEGQWNHVASKQNPADIASRGCSPEQLRDNQLWWKGPIWMVSANQFPPQNSKSITTHLEKRTERSCFIAVETDSIDSFLQRFSSTNKLYRVVAFCLRWKTRTFSTAGSSTASNLTAQEVTKARLAVVRAVQVAYFGAEINSLSSDNDLPKSSILKRHRPFIDDKGTLRVGGRLQYSTLTFQEKHPIIMPKKCHLTDLLIRNAHFSTSHGGPQLVQSFLVRQWWIIQGHSRIRQLIQSCTRCLRYQGKRQSQLMAPLPAVRVTPSRPFTETGLDYAGPFALRTSKGRGQRSFKGYVAVFVCLATRAVHLEIVSDYTSRTFLMALRRFFARRGLSRRIFTDCGTTFQGAASELRQLFTQASSFSQEIAATLANDEVEWQFIPPRAPHFGGIWEAAVKAFKTHLKRVIGDAKLTFEEFSTLAAQIEACLNSRPLCSLSTDPTDFAALTPGHFLVGTALLAAPEPTTAEQIDLVPRWKITTQMYNHFWKRWSKEVLQHMQLRQKWNSENPDWKVGDLVLLTDDQQAPQRWPLARVEKLHPGPDGLTRVVTLKTTSTTLQRPIVKLIKLPVKGEEEITRSTDGVSKK